MTDLSDEIMTFGKAHKGKKFSEIPLRYFDWVLTCDNVHPILREKIQEFVKSRGLSNVWNEYKTQWKDNGK